MLYLNLWGLDLLNSQRIGVIDVGKGIYEPMIGCDSQFYFWLLKKTDDLESKRGYSEFDFYCPFEIGMLYVMW